MPRFRSIGKESDMTAGSADNSPASYDFDDLVKRTAEYLDLCEQRDLEQASTYLSEDAVLIFPGNHVFYTLSDMVDASRGRYQWLTKTKSGYFSGRRVGDGRPFVVSSGTLSGVSADGRPFEHIRYVDMFIFESALIKEQHVFNDLAESGFIARPHKD